MSKREKDFAVTNNERAHIQNHIHLKQNKLLWYIVIVIDDKYTSSVTWLALSVMSSTVMSAILLVSKFTAPPVALSSTLWGLEVRGQSSEAIHTHTNKGAHRKKLSHGNLPPRKYYHSSILSLMLLK